MTHSQLIRSLAVTLLIAGFLAVFSPAASAQGVISDWNKVEVPPAPELKTVTVDPMKTALLVMDFNEMLCGNGAHALKRCMEDIPKVKQLLDEARAHHLFIVYTGYPHMAPIVKELAAMHGEPMVVGHADKFEGTDLEKMLKDHGITTVITTGVVGNGAVLFTAFGAASHDFKVIVPVDTMPGMDAYAEQSSIWGIAHDPGLANMSTLTSVDMIKF